MLSFAIMGKRGLAERLALFLFTLTLISFLVQFRLLALRCLGLSVDARTTDLVFRIEIVCGFHASKIEIFFEIF